MATSDAYVRGTAVASVTSGGGGAPEPQHNLPAISRGPSDLGAVSGAAKNGLIPLNVEASDAGVARNDKASSSPRAATSGTPLRRAPTWAITANSLAFMCVPRAIPACFAQTGWTVGMLALVYSSVVTYDTGLVLGEVCRLRPKIGSYPGLCGEALAACAARRGWSPQAWRDAGAGCCLVLQFATYYLTTVAELIYFEQFFGQLFDQSRLCQWQWLLLAAAVSLPVLQLPTYHETRWAAALLGLLPLAINVAVMFYEVLLVRPWRCQPGPRYDGLLGFADEGGALSGGGEEALSNRTSPQGRDLNDVFLGLSAFAYAFGGHGFYPEEIREMSTPSAWPSVMNWTYGVAIPLYWACGIVGYYAYGDFSWSNINLNFPRNAANTASIGVQVVQEVYFILVGNLARSSRDLAELQPRCSGGVPGRQPGDETARHRDATSRALREPSRLLDNSSPTR